MGYPVQLHSWNEIIKVNSLIQTSFHLHVTGKPGSIPGTVVDAFLVYMKQSTSLTGFFHSP